ncbi:MAG: methyl-accepting chemotaxis protein [Anaerovoracaceae bacterium]
MKRFMKKKKGAEIAETAVAAGRMQGIRARIMRLIGGVLIAAMVVSGAAVLTSVSSTVKMEQSDIVAGSAQGLVYEMDTSFQKYISMAQSAAADAGVRHLLSEITVREGFQSNPYFPVAYETIGNLQKTDSNISMVYAISARTDVGFDGFSWVCDEGFDLKTRAYWFSDSADIERGFIITEPYLDVASGNMVVGIAAPVYAVGSDEIVGVIGIDIQTTDISSLIVNAELSFGKDASMTMLYSGNDEVLASQDDSILLKPVDEIDISSAMAEEVKNPSGSVVSYKYGGGRYCGVVVQDEFSGWKVLLGIERSEYMKYIRSTSVKLIVIYLLAVAVMLVLMYVVTGLIAAPLKRLTAITDELAAGSLDTEIDVQGRDETGQLADSMRKLVDRLREYIAYIDEISDNLDHLAEGNLQVDFRQSYDGEFRRLRDSLEKIAKIYSETLGVMAETSQRVSAGSGQIANAAKALAVGASDQASTTEELTATVHEISDQVSFHAQQARSAAQQAAGVGEKAETSTAQMEQMIAAIEDIEKKSEEISKIIKVIEDISFQTNILALNAAVEAARAGQAGKGFSVVADEVRNLANKSAEAAKDTTVLIEETVQSIRTGTALAEQTGDVLNEVIGGVQETVSLIRGISDASAQQAEALQQTLEGIQQISNVVQNNAATAEESSAASDELSSQAEELAGMLSRFRF